MNRIRNIIITLTGLTVILSAAVISSMPKAETRFDIRTKREDRLLFPGERLISAEFSFPDFNPGENGATFQQVTTFSTGKKQKTGRIYIYIHSIQTFTEFSFLSELLEMQIRVREPGAPGDYFVDAFMIEDTGAGTLLKKDISLGGRAVTLVIGRSVLRTEDNYVPVTTVDLLYGESENKPLNLSLSRIYSWKEQPLTPQLARYDKDNDTYSVTGRFKGDLF